MLISLTWGNTTTAWPQPWPQGSMHVWVIRQHLTTGPWTSASRLEWTTLDTPLLRLWEWWLGMRRPMRYAFRFAPCWCGFHPNKMIHFYFNQVFAELFDPVIKDRHNGYDPRTMKHPTDLDASKVILSSVLCITSSWASMSPCINSYMPNIT